MGPSLAVSWFCRDCFIPDNPCRVCEALTPEQSACSIQARAGSAGSVSGSSQCGPVEGKAFGPSGSTLEPSVKGQGGGGNTSLGPRSQDGGSGVRSSYPPLWEAAELGAQTRTARRILVFLFFVGV